MGQEILRSFWWLVSVVVVVVVVVVAVVVVVVVVVVQDKRTHAWVKHITMSFASSSFPGPKIDVSLDTS